MSQEIPAQQPTDDLVPPPAENLPPAPDELPTREAGQSNADDIPAGQDRASAQPPQADQDPEGDVIGVGSGQGAPVRDPEEWVTGDDPMTDAQRGYLETLARQAGETLPADLTKAQASEHIDRLQAQTGRGN